MSRISPLVIGLIDQDLHVAADMLGAGRALETMAAGDVRLRRHPVDPTQGTNSPSAMSRPIPSSAWMISPEAVV